MVDAGRGRTRGTKLGESGGKFLVGAGAKVERRVVLLDGFRENTATFANWELVKNGKNIAMRDGEKANLFDQIRDAKAMGVHFILIVDEEHRGDTEKAQKIIDEFDADKIIRVSATPIKREHVREIRVSEEDAIDEGMIVREVILNDNFREDGVFANLREYFLDEADKKRRQIREEYRKISRNINPLVLIQFPDEKKSDKEYMAERETLIDEVVSYLTEELGQREENIAKWLSGDHFNTESIEKNDSPVNYLLMKQAISTGWDAPRAKILVKLRLNTNATFTLQTIGRVRRMPEQKHYDNDVLDNAFIYSDDKKYVSEVLKNGGANQVLRYSLAPGAPDFGLKSIKPTGEYRVLPITIATNFAKSFRETYGLAVGKIAKNREKLEANGYIFGTNVRMETASGRVLENAEDNELEFRKYNVPVSTKSHSLDFHDARERIRKYLHTDSDKHTRAVLNEIFTDRGDHKELQLLNLTIRELYAFVINNENALMDEAKKMDTKTEQISFAKNILDGRENAVPFELPKVENYSINDKVGTKLFTKNVYAGYGSRNWTKQTRPERLFEEWLDGNAKIRWWYRSSDRGAQYFSIAYGNKSEGFFPDYIAQTTDERTWILETKGGQNQNIDEYSEAKFKALKEYSEGEWGGDRDGFAFVRPNGDKLFFNNTRWDEDLYNAEVWRPIDEIFE